MTRRQFKDHTFLVMALTLSTLGTCDRKQVGAIITWMGRCVSWGYNGAPPGAPHCEDNHHGWIGQPVVDEYEGRVLIDPVEKYGCRNATHAEANALAFAARQGISTVGGTLYVTLSPCENCARLLLAAGIAEVIYLEEYRDRRGIEILTAAGVDCALGPHGASGIWVEAERSDLRRRAAGTD